MTNLQKLQELRKEIAIECSNVRRFATITDDGEMMFNINQSIKIIAELSPRIEELLTTEAFDEYKETTEDILSELLG